MSIDSAKAFLEKVKGDEAFKKALGQMTDGKARLEAAKAAGFDFTVEELAQAKEAQGLSDEELDGVAGGCGHACLVNIGDIGVW